MPSQTHHLLETVIPPRKAECPLPILFSRLPSGEALSQLGKLVLQLFHPFFKRLRHAEKIDQCSQEFHNDISRVGDLKLREPAFDSRR